MLLPNTNIDPITGLLLADDEYRYGFNSMEKDDEITGVEGSHLDFGARIYDSRVGRWLSTDAHERKYPAISSFVFSLNSPLMFKDPDGNDAIVTVQQDKDGGGKIIISTTIYMVGKGASPELAAKATEEVAKIFVPDIYTDTYGDSYEVSYDVVYEYVSDESKIVKCDGDNILEVSETATHAKGVSVSGIKRMDQVMVDGVWVDQPVSYKAPQALDFIVVSKNSSMQTIAHETYHLFGTDDRYTTKLVPFTHPVDGHKYYDYKTTPDNTWGGDIMDGNGKTINPAHTTIFGEYYAGKQSGQYTLDFFIDFDTSTGEIKYKNNSQATTPIITPLIKTTPATERPIGPLQADGSF